MHRLDARIKFLLVVAFVILVAVTPSPGAVFLTSSAVLIFAGCLLAQIPIGYLLTRSAVVIPFSGLAALSYALGQPTGEVIWHFGPFGLTDYGVESAIILLIRAWIAVSVMILLVNTTPFDLLLKALRSLKIPTSLLLLLSFFYRYLYLLWDEAERLQRARNLRYFGGFWRRQISLLGYLVTSLFLRSYERAERVQQAMIARGWNGEVHLTHSQTMATADVFVLICGALLLLGLWLLRTL